MFNYYLAWTGYTQSVLAFHCIAISCKRWQKMHTILVGADHLTRGVRRKESYYDDGGYSRTG
jgi:hypothetical protein